MDAFQKDIFGAQHKILDTVHNKKKLQNDNSTSKPFLQISLSDGVNEEEASNKAMLIHRILQKKLLYPGLSNPKQKKIFIKILKNEMNIKAGDIEPSTATRDSLITFYL